MSRNGIEPKVDGRIDGPVIPCDAAAASDICFNMSGSESMSYGSSSLCAVLSEEAAADDDDEAWS